MQIAGFFILIISELPLEALHKGALGGCAHTRMGACWHYECIYLFVLQYSYPYNLSVLSYLPLFANPLLL